MKDNSNKITKKNKDPQITTMLDTSVEPTDKYYIEIGIKNETEKKEYDQVVDRMERMEEYRSISCPYQTWSSTWEVNTPNSKGLLIGGGYDWVDYWNNCERGYRRLRKIYAGRSNLKSSTIFAAVEAFLSEVQENNVGINYSGTTEESEKKAKIVGPLDNKIEHVYNFPSERKKNWKTGAVKGSTIIYTGVAYEKCPKELAMTTEEMEKEDKELEEKGDKERIEEYETKSKEGQPRTKKELRERIRFIRASVPLEEVFFDPDSRCVIGQEFEAMDCFRRKVMGYDEAKDMFEQDNDPYARKDVLKYVKPAEESYSEFGTHGWGTRPLFTYNDNIGKNSVVIRYYWNHITDQYWVLINNFLYRKGPMPYNHGKLPFSVGQFVTDERFIYGSGYGWHLMDLQAEKDVTTNQQIEAEHRSQGNYFYDTSVDSDMDFFNANDSMGKYGMDTGGTRAISDLVEYIKPESASYNRRDLMEYFDREEIKLSGINPIQYAIPKEGEAVRNNQAGAESSQRNIQKFLENLMEAEIESKKQMYGKNGLVTQFVTKKRLEDGLFEDIKYLKMDGLQLDPEYREYLDNNKDVKTKVFKGFKEKKINGKGYLELVSDYIDAGAEINFEADLDAWLPPSKSLRVTNVKEMFDNLMEVAADPNVFKNPFQTELIRSYIEEVSPPNKNKLLDLLPEENSDEEAIYAAIQNDIIEKSILNPDLVDEEEVELAKPQAGRSRVHIEQHANKIAELTAQMRMAQRELDTAVDIDPNNLSPEQGQQIMSEVESRQNRISEIGEVIDAIIDHVAIDEQAEVLGSSPVVEEALKLLNTGTPEEQAEGQVPPEGAIPPEQSIGEAGGNAPMEQIGPV